MVSVRHFIIALLFVFAFFSVYAVCHKSGGELGSGFDMTRRAGLIGLAVAAFWSISLVLRNVMSEPTRQLARPAVPPPLGHGRFRVLGVDHQSKMELTEFIFADNEEHAKFKVELKGVEVLEVVRA